jgi:hypothetical protein
MNVCFYCKTPVPGDCVVRVDMRSPRDACDWLEDKRRDVPQLCFHPNCAREFGHEILHAAIRQGPRRGRPRLEWQLRELMEGWRAKPEPDYTKPPKDWRQPSS